MTKRRHFLIVGDDLQMRLVQAVSRVEESRLLEAASLDKGITTTRVNSPDTAGILVLLDRNMPSPTFGLLPVGVLAEFM